MAPRFERCPVTPPRVFPAALRLCTKQVLLGHANERSVPIRQLRPMLPVTRIARRTWRSSASAVTGLGVVACAAPRLILMILADPSVAPCRYGSLRSCLHCRAVLRPPCFPASLNADPARCLPSRPFLSVVSPLHHRCLLFTDICLSDPVSNEEAEPNKSRARPHQRCGHGITVCSACIRALWL
jgi:hypothetical protein